MAQRSRSTSGPTRVPEAMTRTLRRAAAWTGAAAAATGAVLGAIVGLLCWLPDAGVSGHPLSAVKAGVLGFLAAHHGGVTVDGVPFDLVPLLGSAVVVALAWRAGAALAEFAATERRRRAVVEAAAVQAASYLAACLVLAWLSAIGTTSAPPVAVGLASFILFGCVSSASLARSRGAWAAVPGHVVAGTRAAVAALAVYLGAGALLVAASLALHAGRVMELSRQVGGGLSGVPIAVLGVLAAPNAAVAAAAYIAGPGFAVGSGTTFTAFSTGHGVLPAFPLLGALPSGDGAGSIALAWISITILVAGLVAARIAEQREDALRAVAVAASAVGLGMAVLAWFGGGGVGAGRMRTVGASPWQVGLATAGEVAAVALLYLGVRALRRRLVRPAPEAGGEDLVLSADTAR